MAIITVPKEQLQSESLYSSDSICIHTISFILSFKCKSIQANDVPFLPNDFLKQLKIASRL